MKIRRFSHVRSFLERSESWLLRAEAEHNLMAAVVGETSNGNRVGYVFTPPEFRRRGYASICVAELSQRLLRQGRRFCFLFTDMANPTSNAIYQRIGYRPVCDVVDINFV